MAENSEDGRLHLVIGGARSGKSRFAERLAGESGLLKLYLATARVYDDEMAERVTRHKLDRGVGWFTLEEPVEMPRLILARSQPDRIILVECLTLWLTNLMLEGEDVAARVAELSQAMAGLAGPAIFVTNEVGLGIVPDTPLGRAFRDEQGRLNQIMAGLCDRVTLVTAGLPLAIK